MSHTMGVGLRVPILSLVRMPVAGALRKVRYVQPKMTPVSTWVAQSTGPVKCYRLHSRQGFVFVCALYSVGVSI